MIEYETTKYRVDSLSQGDCFIEGNKIHVVLGREVEVDIHSLVEAFCIDSCTVNRLLPHTEVRPVNAKLIIED